MWTDGRTERHDEAEVIFRNFANAPKMHCSPNLEVNTRVCIINTIHYLEANEPNASSKFWLLRTNVSTGLAAQAN